MTALAIDAPGAGGGGVALTQLSGRYVPPEVKKVGSAERKYLHQNTSL